MPVNACSHKTDVYTSGTRDLDVNWRITDFLFAEQQDEATVKEIMEPVAPMSPSWRF